MGDRQWNNRTGNPSNSIVFNTQRRVLGCQLRLCRDRSEGLVSRDRLRKLEK
jgi:hypothetical protein